MHHNEKVRQVMEAAGWKLAHEDEPGIYVRNDATRREDPIAWVSVPPELYQALERHLASLKRVNHA